MVRTLATGVTLALTLLLPAACGSTPGDQAGPTAPRTPTSSPTPSAPKAEVVTVTGRVREGVEAGCVVLVAQRSQESYLLLGERVQAVETGSRVTVRGLPFDNGLATTCQQGVPLMVQEILPR